MGTIIGDSDSAQQLAENIIKSQARIIKEIGIISKALVRLEKSFQDEDIENLILDKMRVDKRVSVKQLSKLFGKSKTSMFRIIDKLKADGKIRRLGSEKSGTWEVIE